ncbi:Crp/Fnr family transcriptional regulator [Ulvibacterium marinum]|uniref:Crp/Fnr family transcriptional regulator n=2 Tax=Ulvibacterium marinum TaxID=2419782 RepID=A0A3B0C546_9FLAO|nr:Crp/Fnr family transcriptional regulator [Ulvibacterium marinum]
MLHSHMDKNVKNEILAQFNPLKLKNKELLVKSGEIAMSMIYIDSGYLRMFNTDRDGNEATVWIGSNGKFITAISSFVFQKPSFWNIEAITDSQVHIIHRDKHFHLCKKYREWLDFENFLLSKTLAALEYRMFVQMNLSAQKRYDEFFKGNPSVFNQIPSKYIASFLGMSPETLSRVRNK